MGGTFAASAQSYSNLWKQVEEAQEKGLPQTVAGLADRIFRKAEREGQAGQLFKAYAVRTYYQQTITPDSIYSDLAAMEQWAVRDANPVNRAVLHTLLAQLYGEYARRNGMQLNRRTNLELTATQVPADIRRWSGRQFVQQVSAHVTAMLKEQEALLATSSRDYIPYIIQGETGRYFGHDMFRLLTGYALRALNDVKDVDTGDTTKAFIASLRQQRADAYRNKPDRQDALVLILADDYDGNVSALDSLIRIYGAQDVCAELYLSKATTLRHGRRNVEALKACDEAIARYPRYPRINELRNQRAIILKPYLFIYTDMTCYPGDSVNLTVRHNNLDGFELLTMQQGHVLSRRHFDLKRPADYMTEDSVFRFAVPTRPGKYTLQLTEKWNKDYDIGDLCVTRLKAISIGWGGKNYEVKVMDSKSGQPVGDARVEFYNANDSLLTVRTTDADGRVMLEWPASSTRRNNVVQLRATKGSDTGMALQRMGGYIDYSWQSREEENVQLLTDRPIYRPGQTIYIKGVAYRQRGDTAAVRTDAPFTVTLRDVNGKEIATTTVRTGDFGSFATQFTLPAACLNGGYTIDASPSGSRTLVQVEEYKRPTFEVTFDTLKTTYQLGDTVQLSGRVMSFSGVPVQDVLLQYRVNCSVFLYMPLRDDYRSNFELLTDSVRVGEDGRFRFPLVLKNDEVGLDGIGEDTYYRFLYKVAADVTNLSGETQSAATDIVVGNRSMTLSFAGGDGQLICKEDTTRYLHFDALNLNGQPIDVKGTYTLTKKGELAPTMQGTFVANHPTPVTQWEQLPTGEYELRLSANDSQGREVKHVTTLTLFSYYDNRPAATKEMWTYTLNNRFDASRPAQFNFGTSLADVHVQMDVFRLGKHLESRTFQLTDSVVRFEVPYKEEYGDGITYLFAFVKNGTLHQQSIPLYKRDPDRTLRLKWTVFRDKLRPGQQEEWRLTVTTPQGTPADAELLAQMYDASLDKLYSRNKVFRVSYQRFVPNMSWSSDYVRNLNVSRSFRSRSFTAPRLEYDRLYDPSGIFGMFSGAAEIPAARDMVGVRSMAFRKSVVMNDVAYAEEEEVMEEEVYDVGVHLVDPASLRTNFSETAFFYPQLRTNAEGEVVIAFTLPESLTRWNFFGYAHTRDMLTGMLKGTATASKEFMLQPNLPRFVRVGDDTSMAATVTNLTAKEITGDVRLELFDPMSDKVIARQRQRFRAAAGKTTAVGFHFTATDKYQLLGVRLVADGGDFSDGEQHVLPVLSNSIYLTETLTMPIRGNESRTFALDTLFNHNSRTATNRRLTVEFTGNPAWSAVQSLPALSQPMQDNATAYAVTYYANTLAAYVLNSTPRIKAVLDSWRQSGNKEAFLSTLQQNQELKNIL
ncbi:MAG: alpha-2-macroglobulin, partial [Prevotellaceae bacterium]|nr:alpha-2-macroglobulin [Prevotellaceae bacterium]